MVTNDPIAELLTAEDLLRTPDDGFRYELVRGKLRKMAPSGFEQGDIAMDIGESLRAYVKAHNLGTVVAEAGFQLAHNPDTVRTPDIAFVRQERIQQTGKPKEYFPGPPDLAVEVISPDDTYTEVDDKVLMWLSFGMRIVLVVNPRNKTVTVHQQPQSTRLTEKDILDVGDAVPGWAMKVADVFA